MFPTMTVSSRWTCCLGLVVLLSPSVWAQSQTPDIPPPSPNTKVVIVPMPGDPAQNPPVEAVPPVAQQQAPQPIPNDVPPPQPQAEPDLSTRTLDATPPPPLPPEQLDTAPKTFEPQGPQAMIDGHPREGAFLSGPGSFTFIMHHTLMTGLGALATQMIPRAIDPTPGAFTNEGARIAYLASGLGGAAIGFAGSAIWQFTHWMGERSANFGIINSFFGGMFLGGLTDLFTKDAYAIAWLTVIGNSAGAWLTAIVGGGDMALNKGVLITSGGVWAGIYTALIIGIISSIGGASSLRTGMDALMITPAIGAAAMALATLKFNPSTTQIMRANIFGVGVGGAVLLLSALVLGAHFSSPVPYILSGVGAIGAKTLVSLLWAEAAEAPTTTPISNQPIQQRISVFW